MTAIPSESAEGQGEANARVPTFADSLGRLVDIEDVVGELERAKQRILELEKRSQELIVEVGLLEAAQGPSIVSIDSNLEQERTARNNAEVLSAELLAKLAESVQTNTSLQLSINEAVNGRESEKTSRIAGEISVQRLRQEASERSAELFEAQRSLAEAQEIIARHVRGIEEVSLRADALRLELETLSLERSQDLRNLSLLKEQHNSLKEAFDSATEDRLKLLKDIENVEVRYRRLKQSLSWRVTRPLRALGKLLGRNKTGGSV